MPAWFEQQDDVMEAVRDHEELGIEGPSGTDSPTSKELDRTEVRSYRSAIAR